MIFNKLATCCVIAALPGMAAADVLSFTVGGGVPRNWAQQAAPYLEILADRFGLKYWYTALSASDANRFSIKIARMLTGRPRILMFNLAYHGTVDETLKWTLEPGVVQRRFHVDYEPDQDPAATTRIATWNDLESVEDALRHGDVALVISEPALTNTGIVMPEPGFHEGLRALCTRYGAYLLIDETHTLSEGPRGCTGEWGLEPDFWVAGKAIASGVPCAVYGFNEEVGERLAVLLAADDPHAIRIQHGRQSLYRALHQ